MVEYRHKARGRVLRVAEGSYTEELVKGDKSWELVEKPKRQTRKRSDDESE